MNNRSKNKISYGEGYVVQGETPRYLQGRIFTIIEALGLRDGQEKSLKDLILKEIWDEFNNGTFIHHTLNDEIKRCYQELREDSEKNTPNGELVKHFEVEFKVSYIKK